jgi:hypothetical protein
MLNAKVTYPVCGFAGSGYDLPPAVLTDFLEPLLTTEN